MDNSGQAVHVKEPKNYKLLNKVLSFVDGIVGRFGIWYRWIFLLFVPTVAMCFPIRLLSSGIVQKYQLKEFTANPIVMPFCLLGIFFLILYFVPPVASAIEAFVCSFYVLLKGLGVSNFVVYKFDAYSGRAISVTELIGVIICSLLLLGKLIFLIYKMLKRYRKNHMTKKLVKSDYYSNKFYTQNSVVLGDEGETEKEEEEPQTNVTDATGFITNAGRPYESIKGRRRPDASGFIIDDRETEKEIGDELKYMQENAEKESSDFVMKSVEPQPTPASELGYKADDDDYIVDKNI